MRETWVRRSQADKSFRPGKSLVQPAPQIVGWTCQRAEGGRSFACTGPHFHSSFQNEDLRRLVLNAILWTAKIEVPQGGVQSNVSPKEDIR